MEMSYSRLSDLMLLKEVLLSTKQKVIEYTDHYSTSFGHSKHITLHYFALLLGKHEAITIPVCEGVNKTLAC